MKILRDQIYHACRDNFKAQIEKHVVNAEILMSNPVGVAEHPDVMESLEKELSQIAHYNDLLEALQNYLQKVLYFINFLWYNTNL